MIIYENLKLNDGKLYKIKRNIPAYGYRRYKATEVSYGQNQIVEGQMILFTGITTITKLKLGYEEHMADCFVFLVGKRMLEINGGWMTTAYLEEIK